MNTGGIPPSNLNPYGAEGSGGDGSGRRHNLTEVEKTDIDALIPKNGYPNAAVIAEQTDISEARVSAYLQERELLGQPGNSSGMPPDADPGIPPWGEGSSPASLPNLALTYGEPPSGQGDPGEQRQAGSSGALDAQPLPPMNPERSARLINRAKYRKARDQASPYPIPSRSWPKLTKPETSAPAPPQASTSNAAAQANDLSRNDVAVTVYEHSSPQDQALMGRLGGFQRGQGTDGQSYLITPQGGTYQLKGASGGPKAGYSAEAVASFRALRGAADNADPPIGHTAVSALFGMNPTWFTKIITT